MNEINGLVIRGNIVEEPRASLNYGFQCYKRIIVQAEIHCLHDMCIQHNMVTNAAFSKTDKKQTCNWILKDLRWTLQRVKTSFISS